MAEVASDEAWSIAMDAVLEHHPEKAARIVKDLTNAETEAALMHDAPAAFGQVLRKAPAHDREKFFELLDVATSAKIEPPRRVQILPGDEPERRHRTLGESSYWKPGQFGFAIAWSTHPGMYTERGPTVRGEKAYLVSKTKEGRGGASWFSPEGLRFTKPPSKKK